MLDSVYKILLLAHPQHVPILRALALSVNPKTIFLGLHLVLNRQNA